MRFFNILPYGRVLIGSEYVLVFSFTSSNITYFLDYFQKTILPENDDELPSEIDSTEIR